METDRTPTRSRTFGLPRHALMHAASWLIAVMAVSAIAAPPFEPALAKHYREGLALERYWVSEKYDGVRALWDGQRLYSRQGIPIAAPRWFTQDWPPFALDGELWAGRGRFEITQSTVAQGNAGDARWSALRFMVFDSPRSDGDFSGRMGALSAWLTTQPSPYIEAVTQWRVFSHEELMGQLRAMSAKGAEGLMLHREDAPYRGGRSDDLLKLKLHDDAEAVVIAHLPGKGKYQGMTGALKVRAADGRVFQLGSGLSDAQRRDPPPIGSTVTYRFNGLHPSGLPRFARLWRVRIPQASPGMP